MKIFFSVFLLSMTTVFSQALTWDKTENKIETVTSTTKYESSFTYTNTSDKEIIFTKVKASCGCVLLSSPKKVGPGEAGKITFKAPVPRAGGTYRKSIKVDTDETDKLEYVLSLQLTNTDKPAPRITSHTLSKKTDNGSANTKKTQGQGYVRPETMTKKALIAERLLSNRALRQKASYSKQDECPFLPLDINPKLFHDHY